MAKENCWFKHDASAGRGLRLRKIQHIYGHEGKGFYWDVIEILREQTGYKYSFKDTDLQMLASIIGAKDDMKFINFLKDCVKFELLEVKDNFLYSKVLNENMKVLETKKRNASGIKAKKKQNSSIRLDKIRLDKNIKKEEDRIPIPFGDSFSPVWEKWLNYRKAIKKPYKTVGSENEQLEILAKYTQPVVEAAIQKAIASGWQGIFPENIKPDEVKTGDGVKSIPGHMIPVSSQIEEN